MVKKMKIKDFNSMFKIAETCHVSTDDRFLTAGWFWIALTEKQSDKMFDLMERQGDPIDSEGWITMGNGLRIRRSQPGKRYFIIQKDYANVLVEEVPGGKFKIISGILKGAILSDLGDSAIMERVSEERANQLKGVL